MPPRCQNSTTRPDQQQRPVDSLHELKAVGGRLLAKQFSLDGEGNLVEQTYDQAYRYIPREVRFNGLNGLLAELHRLEHQRQVCLVRGGITDTFKHVKAIRRLLHERPDALPTLEDRGRTLVVIDIDKVQCPEHIDPRTNPMHAIEWVRSQLPASFNTAACVWQWSASAFVKDDRTLKLHFYFLADRAVTSAELERWRRANDTQRIIDPAPLRPAQCLFTAAPIFHDGIADPVPGQRMGMLAGDTERVHLTIPPEPSKVASKPRKEGAHNTVSPEQAPGTQVDCLEVLGETAPDRTHPYAMKALENMGQELAQADVGDRHYTAYKLLARGGAFVAGGLATLPDVLGVAEEAGETCGVRFERPDDWARLVRDGLLRGAQEPAQLPEHPDDRRARELSEELSDHDLEAPRYMPRQAFGPGVKVLHADLGSGKTEQLVAEANRVRAAGGNVLVVTHRRSLVQALGRRMRVPTHLDLLDEGLELTFAEGSIVLCLDSLWRVPADRVFDLIIIEESEETFAQFFASTLPRGRSKRSAGAQFGLLKKLGHACKANGGMIVAADAFASSLTTLGLELITGTSFFDIERVHHQRSRARVSLSRYEDKAGIVAAAVAATQANRRCLIPGVRKADVLVLERLLVDQGLSVRAYHGDMDSEVRDELRDVERHWSQHQVVLFSPAVDTGVSYDLPDCKFDDVFLIADRAGVTAHGWTSLLQMVARVRGARRIHAFVVGAHFYPLDRSKIEEELEQRWRATRRSALRCGHDEPILERDDPDFFRLRVEVERQRRATSRDRSLGFFGFYKARGATVEDVAPLDAEAAKAIRDTLRAARQAVVDEIIEAASRATLLMRDQLTRDYEPRTAAERASLRRTLTHDALGRSDEDLLRRDFSGRLRREVRRYIQASLICDELWPQAARRDLAAAQSGYRAHGEGDAAAMEACLILETVALGPEWVAWSMLAPAHTSATGTPSMPRCVPRFWTESDAAWDDLEAALQDTGLSFADLARAGVRRGQGWCKALGTALRYRGIRTRRSQPRGPDGRRISQYSINLDSVAVMRELAAVGNARQRGWDIDPLSRSYTGDEWHEAAEDGRWLVLEDTVADSTAECDELLAQAEDGTIIDDLAPQSLDYEVPDQPQPRPSP